MSLYNLINTYIILFGKEGVKGNTDLAIKNLREALTYFINLRDKKESVSIFISAFKHIISAKKTELLKMALNEIKTSDQSELLEALSPYLTFIKYLETKDSEIIDRLRHEERIVVEDMLRMVEDKTEEKPEKAKRRKRQV